MLSILKREFLLSPLEDSGWGDPWMKFRLYYEGELKPTQRDALAHERDKLAAHKQELRRVFHRQLRHLWRTNGFLSSHKEHPDGSVSHRSASDSGAYFDYPNEEKIPLSELLASRYQKFGYSFVPLVRDEISLLCSLDVLFLRRDIPGSALQAGDIDNRIKTLIDGLRAPNSPNELVGDDKNPSPDEEPLFWPAAGFVDTEIRCLTELESWNAKKEVQPRVQA